MREGDEERVSAHEAGHAVAYFVTGRPIEYAIVTPEVHEVQPLEGTRCPMPDAALAMAAGWAAEERRLRLAGLAQDEIETERMNGGHHNDRQKLLDLAAEEDDVDVDETESRAAQFCEEYWDLILTVADALRTGPALDQAGLARLGAIHDVEFGQGRSANGSG